MLHWYEIAGKVVFWAENVQEMEIPRYMSLHTRQLGRLWGLGGAWQVDAGFKALLIGYAESRRRGVCAECDGKTPCLRFATHTAYWAAEFNRRAERAEQYEQSSRVAQDRPKSKPFARTLAVPKRDARQDAALTLGLAWPCTRDDVKRAFREAVRKNHPDLGGTDEKMRAMLEAREILESGL